MKHTYYRWTAESIVMADPRVARDLLAAISHAREVPGNITAAQANRLGKLATELRALLPGAPEAIAS